LSACVPAKNTFKNNILPAQVPAEIPFQTLSPPVTVSSSSKKTYYGRFLAKILSKPNQHQFPPKILAKPNLTSASSLKKYSAN
jgi:hypothetical protein